MARMTREEPEAFLASPDHRGTAILSVPRPGRGPISVPVRFGVRRWRVHVRHQADFGTAVLRPETFVGVVYEFG